jgi:type IV secretory pathway TrbL component
MEDPKKQRKRNLCRLQQAAAAAAASIDEQASYIGSYAAARWCHGYQRKTRRRQNIMAGSKKDVMSSRSSDSVVNSPLMLHRLSMLHGICKSYVGIVLPL